MAMFSDLFPMLYQGIHKVLHPSSVFDSPFLFKFIIFPYRNIYTGLSFVDDVFPVNIRQMIQDGFYIWIIGQPVSQLTKKAGCIGIRIPIKYLIVDP